MEMTGKETNVIVPIETDDKMEEGAQTFSWRHISLEVMQGKEVKKLLSNVSGEVHAGEIIAIMGGSGAGKSTLLNTLAGRLADNVMLAPETEILIDGVPRHSAVWKLQCAYVEQDDILFKNLTVFETLLYSARLRLPSKYTRAERINRVNKVIAQLGLEACRNNRIGDEIKRGISGGERKRVSIGIELVTNPHILFLDEPTSGLDAFNAFNAMETIKKLAKAEGKIVLVTIHQPRTDILELFDKIILLSMGKLVWFGTTNDAIDHFAGLGYHLPPKTNPSDFFLDTVTIDRRSPELYDTSKARIDKFFAAYELLEKKTLKDIPKKPELTHQRVNWPSMWIVEYSTLADRFMLNDSRELTTFVAQIGQAMFIALVMSGLYWQVTNDAAGIQNRLGVFMFITMNLTFGVVMPAINQLAPIKRLMKRERAAGSYRATSAFLAKVSATIPSLLVSYTVMVIPVYFAVGLHYSVNNVLTFYLICIVHALAANQMGLLIGSAVPNVTVGQIFIRWLQWVSLVGYTFKAFAQNEFNGLTFTCKRGQQCAPTGELIITAFSLDTPTMWSCVAINAGFGGFFLLLGMYVFARTSRPLEKLK